MGASPVAALRPGRRAPFSSERLARRAARRCAPRPPADRHHGGTRRPAARRVRTPDGADPAPVRGEGARPRVRRRRDPLSRGAGARPGQGRPECALAAGREDALPQRGGRALVRPALPRGCRPRPRSRRPDRARAADPEDASAAGDETARRRAGRRRSPPLSRRPPRRVRAAGARELLARLSERAETRLAAAEGRRRSAGAPALRRGARSRGRPLSARPALSLHHPARPGEGLRRRLRGPRARALARRVDRADPFGARSPRGADRCDRAGASAAARRGALAPSAATSHRAAPTARRAAHAAAARALPGALRAPADRRGRRSPLRSGRRPG